jgi:hypothetical protein
VITPIFQGLKRALLALVALLALGQASLVSAGASYSGLSTLTLTLTAMQNAETVVTGGLFEHYVNMSGSANASATPSFPVGPITAGVGDVFTFSSRSEGWANGGSSASWAYIDAYVEMEQIGDVAGLVTFDYAFTLDVLSSANPSSDHAYATAGIRLFDDDGVVVDDDGVAVIEIVTTDTTTSPAPVLLTGEGTLTFKLGLGGFNALYGTTDTEGASRATAIPLPATPALVLLGLIAIPLLGRRRR